MSAKYVILIFIFAILIRPAFPAAPLETIRDRNRAVEALAAKAVVGIDCINAGAHRTASGVVVARSGLILTSATAISGSADSIFVVLASGNRVRATMLARDEHLDAALLRVDNSNIAWTPLALAARQVKVGDVAFTNCHLTTTKLH